MRITKKFINSSRRWQGSRASWTPWALEETGQRPWRRRKADIEPPDDARLLKFRSFDLDPSHGTNPSALEL